MTRRWWRAAIGRVQVIRDRW